MWAEVILLNIYNIRMSNGYVCCIIDGMFGGMLYMNIRSIELGKLVILILLSRVYI